MPECASSLGDLGTKSGELSFTTWTLALGQGPFSASTVDDAAASGMADTVFHEARHAEQWHRMARYVAGLGKSAAEIAAEMFIPARIAADAVAQKYEVSSAESTEAESWYQSVYGTGADERNKVITGLTTLATALATKRTELEAAQKAYEDIKDDASVDDALKDTALVAWQQAYAAWQEAKKAHDENYAKYRALAEEADAWQVGGAVQAAYLA